MNFIREFFDSVSYGALSGIVIAVVVIMIGGGTLVVGGIWVLWKFLAWLHLPVMILFRIAAWVFFWPGLLVYRFVGKIDDLSVVVISLFGWLICSAVLLYGAKFVISRLQPNTSLQPTATTRGS